MSHPEGVALGHSRLSIVDHRGGAQPMVSDDARYSITFNGEIYGYRRIREQLEYSFASESDTEVILALFKERGASMLNSLPGMFAFSIWDSKTRRLTCARDRFGEKPFYYALGKNGEFIFASEVKAILATGLVEAIVDLDSVAHFLRKLYVDPIKTIYKNIHSLKPGHYLDVSEGCLKERRYWDFPETKEPVSLCDATEQVEWLLECAVKDQLIADVPVGAFLSGGLDSSSIVASAVQHRKDLMTLTYRFQSGLDEGPYAQAIANQYQTKHIEMNEAPFRLDDALIALSHVYDEPFADTSNIPTYQICKAARQHCKVVLTGDGADELFGGYAWKYRPLHYQLALKGQSPFRLLAGFIANKSLAKALKRDRFTHMARAYRNEYSGKSLPQSMDDLYFMFGEDELADLGLPCSRVKGGVKLRDLNDAFKEDMQDYMAGDILVKTDRASMAHGLELRSPFLDHKLVEYVMALPSLMKIDAKNDKILLRQLFEKSWPEPVRKRSKQGFGSPIARWLSMPEMKEAKAYYFSAERRYAKYLDSKAVSKYRDGTDIRTWALLVFSIWCETWKA